MNRPREMTKAKRRLVRGAVCAAFAAVICVLSPFAIPAEKTVLGGINSSLVIDLPLMLGVMAIMCLPALIKGKLQRWQGILLLCIYAGFTVYQFVV